MRDFGLNDCWIRRYIPKKPFCVEARQGGEGIPFSSILFSVWVLASGFLISLAILALEKVVHVVVPVHFEDGATAQT